jgi:hypothetical protein
MASTPEREDDERGPHDDRHQADAHNGDVDERASDDQAELTSFTVEEVMAEAAKDEGAAAGREDGRGGRGRWSRPWAPDGLVDLRDRDRLVAVPARHRLRVRHGRHARSPFHLAFAIVLTFLVFPARRRGGAKHIPWYDFIAAAVAGLGVLYLVIDYHGIQTRFGIPIQREVILGTVTILLLLEATRRSLGPALSIVAACSCSTR